MDLKIVHQVTADNHDDAKSEAYDWAFENGFKKCDGIVLHYQDKMALFTCCPNCGIGSSTSTHIVSVQNGLFTVSPSLIYQCCGWHGFIIENKFTIEPNK